MVGKSLFQIRSKIMLGDGQRVLSFQACEYFFSCLFTNQYQVPIHYYLITQGDDVPRKNHKDWRKPELLAWLAKNNVQLEDRYISIQRFWILKLINSIFIHSWNTDLGSLIGNKQCENFWIFLSLIFKSEIDFGRFEAPKTAPLTI